ncbi:MAG: hypothetical protein AAB465_03295 [Patescibacteria group bacterium]
MQKTSLEELAGYYKNKSANNHKDFTKYNKPIWPRFLIVVFIILFLSAIAILSGFLYFGNNVSSGDNKKVSIDIISPDKVKSFANSQFKIIINNQEKFDLRNAELVVNWPEDFKLDENSLSEPCAHLSSGCEWPTFKLRKDETKEISFNGYFQESLAKQKLTAKLDYYLADFTSKFAAIIEKEVNIEPVINFELTSPQNLIIGQEALWGIRITNLTDKPMQNVRIYVDGGKDFVIDSLNESVSGNYRLSQEINQNKYIDISILSAGSPLPLSFDAHFDDFSIQNRSMKITAGLLNENQSFFAQQKVVSDLFLSLPSLSIGLSIKSDTPVLDWEQELPVIFHYENNGEQDLKDLAITLSIDNGDVIDWRDLTRTDWSWRDLTKENSVVVSSVWRISSNKILQWDKNQLPILSKISAGEKGEISFKMKLSSFKDFAARKSINPTLSLLLKINGLNFSDEKFFINTPSYDYKISNQISLTGEARYYSDEMVKIGRGILPPKVGEETTYKIYIYIQNGSSEINNVNFKANLPANVTLLDQSQLESNFSYNQGSREVGYKIDKIEPYNGVKHLPKEISFSVTLVPVADQVGGYADLLKNLTLSGNDSFTEQNFNWLANNPTITTNLSFDPIAGNKGKVQP